MRTVASAGELKMQPDPQRRGVVVWLTGLSGAGKSTIARAAEAELVRRGVPVEVLDGDIIRKRFSSGLGFSREDRNENVRRAGYVAGLLSRHGVVVFVALISPYRAARKEAREEVLQAGGKFMEVYVNAPLEICERRDPKGLYRKARLGEIASFTGVVDPYEPPLTPEVECHTDSESIEESTDEVLAALDCLLCQSQFIQQNGKPQRRDTGFYREPERALLL